MNLLTFSTLACPGWSVDTVIAKAVEFGYRGIEWRGGPEGHIQPGMSSRKKADFRRMSNDAGLITLAITTYTTFTSPLPEERKSNVDELKRYADLAVDVGAGYIRAFLGELPATTNLDSRIYENIAECLRVASEYASTLGVKIAVEPHDEFTRSSLVWPVFEKSHPDLRVIWDLGNTFAAGEDPVEGFDILKDRLAYVQVKDGKMLEAGWQLCSLGEGQVPLARAFELLSDYGYDGAFSVEWEYAWHPELDPPEIALPAALQTMKTLLSSIESEPH